MKNFFLITLILMSISQPSFSEDLNMKRDEFPKKEMKSQNKEIVRLVSEEISKTLPQRVDKYTTFVSIAGSNTTLIYTFEINSGSKSDEAIKNEDRTRMKKAVKQGICQSSNKFLEAGINISYIYTSAKTKTRLFEFNVKQEDCIKFIS